MPLSTLIVPVLLAFTACFAARKRVDVYAALTKGAEEGLAVLLHILPTLIALLSAVYMLRASGATEALGAFLAPALDVLGIPAETAPLHEFETPRVFEGCMPVEVMAKRGPMTLAYGPLKPVGIVDPRTGKRPYAVVQLRKENNEATLYNIVGFQTNLKFGEQKRVFGMIPGLENAEFVRYGVMHRNTFINSPGKLTPWFECIAKPGLYFAGQMIGDPELVMAGCSYVVHMEKGQIKESYPLDESGSKKVLDFFRIRQ